MFSATERLGSHISKTRAETRRPKKKKKKKGKKERNFKSKCKKKKKKKKKKERRKEFLSRSVEKTSKKFIVESLYLDLEDLKQSKSDDLKNNKKK